MKLFDVHTHIQDLRLLSLRDEVIERSITNNIKKIMCCGTHEGDWDAVSEMADKYHPVMASYGLHPWFIESRSDIWLDRLEQLIRDSSAGVGEIGLDRMIQNRGDAEQEKVFIDQLKLSQKYQRPVSIHCRKAWGVMPDLIKNNGGLPFGAVVHSWSGSIEMVKVFEKMGAYISFSGSITRENNKKSHKACKEVSKDRLLIETDSPDIIPSGVKTDLNEPCYIIKVLEKVAELRGEDISEVAGYTYENSVRLFGNKSDRKGENATI